MKALITTNTIERIACGLYTAFAVTLMHKNFLDKLVEHDNGQLIEVLIFVNQSDKTVSVLFVLLIALDCLFQNRDFNGKLGLFLFVLSVQSVEQLFISD